MPPSDRTPAEKTEPLNALTAGGWQKPTAPPIRVASQAIQPGLPPAPQQAAPEPKFIFMSAEDKNDK